MKREAKFGACPPILAVLLLISASSLYAQHGVVRQYAAFAPKPEAVPLRPLFEADLTETSITRGPDQAFYLTGSTAENGRALPSNRLKIWRSLDLKKWQEIRTLDLGSGKYCSPEIHFLKVR